MPAKNQKKRDLTIYPIKMSDDKLNQGNAEEKYPLNNPVHLHLLVGRVKSGKSLLMNNLYLSSRFFGDDYKTKILISSTAYNDAVNKYMLEDFDFVFTEYSDDLLQELMDIIKDDEGDGRFLIIFDDVIGSNQNFKRTGKTDLLTQIITTYRHIGNGEFEGKLAIAIAVQYFKYLSPIARNNCSGVLHHGALSGAGGEEDGRGALHLWERRQGVYAHLQREQGRPLRLLVLVGGTHGGAENARPSAVVGIRWVCWWRQVRLAPTH